MFNWFKRYLLGFCGFVVFPFLNYFKGVTYKPSDIPRLWRKYWFFISGKIAKRVFVFNKNDFVLRIAPLKKHHLKANRDYYPPPGYGVPPNARQHSNPGCEKYGLFLWPARLNLWFDGFLLFFLVFSVGLPFWFGFPGENNIFWLKIILGTIFVAIILNSFLYRIIPPVLSKVWKDWPESQYPLFLTVPNLVDLSRNDKKRKKDESIYWDPDKETPKKHQSSYYATGMYPLQEVILHLAIFDFFFHNQISSAGKITDDSDSIKMKNWIIYLFSPVWLSYFIILFSLFLYQLLPPSFSLNRATIIQYPYNIAWLSVFWFIFSSLFVYNRIRLLKKQEKAVLAGYYETHLKLVPQQILNAITQIPSKKQIRDGIEKMEKVSHAIQTVGLVTLLMLVEIFSSPYSQSTQEKPPSIPHTPVLHNRYQAPRQQLQQNSPEKSAQGSSKPVKAIK